MKFLLSILQILLYNEIRIVASPGRRMVMPKYSKFKQQLDFIYIHSKSVGEYTIPLHVHDVYELYLCVSDNINYLIDGKHHELHKYDLVITNNHEPHYPYMREKGVYERKIIQFRKEYLADFYTGEHNPLPLFDARRSGEHNVIKSHHVLGYDLLHYFNTIGRFYEKPYPKSNEIMVKTLLLQLITQINTIIHEHIEQEDKSGGEEVIALIHQDLTNHAEQNITLDHLTEKYFMNKYYLCHAFKKRYKITILEYLHQQRIEKAKHLLLEGIPITQVCYLVGFNDYSNFYKKFKKLVGLSPKAYVREHLHIQ